MENLIIVKGNCKKTVTEHKHKYNFYCNTSIKMVYRCVDCGDLKDILYITDDNPFNWSYKDKADYINKNKEFFSDAKIQKFKA